MHLACLFLTAINKVHAHAYSYSEDASHSYSYHVALIGCMQMSSYWGSGTAVGKRISQPARRILSNWRISNCGSYPTQEKQNTAAIILPTKKKTYAPGAPGREFAIPKQFSYGGNLEQSDWLKTFQDTPTTEIVAHYIILLDNRNAQGAYDLKTCACV